MEDLTQQIDPTPKEKLWKSLNDARLYTKSYNEFNNQFNSSEKIDGLYGKLNSAKYYTKSPDDFKSQYFSDDVKKKDLPQGSKNTSTVFTKPSQPSQASSNLFGGKPQNEFIGEDNAQRIVGDIENPNQLGLKPLAFATKSKGTIGFRKDGLAGAFQENIGGGYASPSQIVESERLKAINEQYQGDKKELELGIDNKSPDTLTQGVADGDDLEGNKAGYWYNKMLSGFGAIASFTGDLGSQLAATQNQYANNGQPRDRFQQGIRKTGTELDEANKLGEAQLKDYRENTAPTIRDYLKNTIGANVDSRLENEYNNQTFTSAIGGLSYSLPAIGATILSGGLGSFAMTAQAFDNSIESINSTAEGRNLDEATKTFFAGGVALVNTALEKTSLNFILKSKSGIVSDLIAKQALKGAIKATDGKVTGDIFTKFLDKEILSLTNKYVIGGARAVDGALAEYGTEFAQEGVSIGSELLVNKLTGKSVFNTKAINSWDGFISNIERANKSGVGGLIGGGLLGGVASLANLNKIKIDQNEQIISNIDKQIVSEGISETTKELLIQNKIKLQQELDAYAVKIDEAYNKLPEAKKDEVNAIVEQKVKIKEAISDTTVTPEIKSLLENQEKELDNQLSEIKPSEAVTTKAEAITPTEEVVAAETIKPTENDKLPTNNTQSQVQGEIQPIKDEVVPVKVEDAKTTPIPKVEEVGGSEVVADKTPEQNITDISKETGLQFTKSKNSNSWYSSDGSKKIRISDHPSKFVEKSKEFNGDDAIDLDYNYYSKDAIVHLIKGTNPFDNYKSGDKIIHSNNKIGEVEYLNNDYKKGYVEVLTQDGRTVKYDMGKFFSKENNLQNPKQSLPTQEAKSSVPQGTEKSNLDLEFISDKDIPKEVVDAYNKKGKLAGTTEVPNEKILNKQNEIRKNLETLKKFTKCLTT